MHAVVAPEKIEAAPDTYETLEQSLVRIEAEIDELEAARKPLARVQLLGPSFGKVDVGPYRRKVELGIQIDQRRIEQAVIRQQMAEQELERLTNASPDFAGEIEKAKAEVSRLEDALTLAAREMNRLRSAEAEQRNQTDTLRQRIADAEFDLERWTKEEERDRERLAEAGMREAMQQDEGFGPV